MRVLLLTHAFNSLTQRLYVELAALGHAISIELDINDAVTREAVALFGPDLILAPFLKRAIPEDVWREHVCLVVHPGIAGDRGPSALDWAIMDGESGWGVTVLQAEAELDAGPVWAAETFAMRPAKKSSLYRNEVTESAVRAASAGFGGWVAEKRRRRLADESAKPLAAYRAEELRHMRRNFQGFDPSYHVARYHFVHKTPHSWAPRHLARHRELGWTIPEG